MKIISVMQPTVHPWMGYFTMIAASDIFVVYDDVQLTKQSWQTRNKILLRNGKIHWLSIPICKDRLSTLIKDVKINNDVNWKKKHLKTIENAYSKSAYFHWFYPILESYYQQDHTMLSGFTYGFIKLVCEILNIDTKLVKSSDLVLENKEKNLRLIEIINYFDGCTYISPLGSKEYLNVDLFDEKNVQVKWMIYEPPKYKQISSDFIPYLSIIDALFNIGMETEVLIKNSVVGIVGAPQ